MNPEQFNLPPDQAEKQEEVSENTKSKKSGWLKKAFAIGSAVAATSFGNMEAKAENPDITDGLIDSQPKIEKTDQEQKMMEVDMTKITVASLWSEEALAKAKSEQKELETIADASAFFQSTFKDFFMELKWPSEDKGRGTTRLTRDGTRDDFKFLFNNTLEMSKIAEGLLNRFDYTDEQKANVRSLIDPRLTELRDKASYRAEKNREMWEKLLKKEGN